MEAKVSETSKVAQEDEKMNILMTGESHFSETDGQIIPIGTTMARGDIERG